jgi:hypothetical protein
VGLGHCALAAGRDVPARHLMRQAVQIFQRIGAADATDLQPDGDAPSPVEPAL